MVWSLLPFLALYGLAAVTAGLRVASGRRSFTDVITGAAMGTTSSRLIVMLHERREDWERSAGLDVYATGQGMYVRGTL